MSKVKSYSTERLKSELRAAKSRLERYEKARASLPASSILGSLSVACGIKYETKFINELVEELRRRREEVSFKEED